MTDHRSKYKQKGLSFGDPERSRISRAEKRDEQRKEIRAQNFSRLRPLAETSRTQQTPGKSAVTTSRNEKLQKWKQQKEMKKKTENKVVKPPFKVGVVHHRVFSPPLRNSAAPSCSHSHSHSSVRSRVQQQTTPVKRITRVTEKRLAAKAAAKAKATEKKSFAPPNYKFKAPAGLPNIPLFGRVKKGSIDASKLTWNLNDKTPTVKVEPRNSLTSQRKKSTLITRDSPRRSKKFRTSYEAEESMISNSQNKAETRISGSHNSRASDSSIDSISLRVSSDDAEVFDFPAAESSCINMEMQKKESTLKEMLLNLAQPSESSQISQLKDKDPPPSELDSGNFSLQSQEKVDSLQKADKAPEIHQESELQKMDTSSSEFVEKSLNDSLREICFSPYVVMRRGKKEARKEQRIRRGFTPSPEEIPTKETIMQSLNISIEEEKRTSQYFNCLLESETNRLNEQCELWNNVIINENPPEEAKAIVEQAIGQTKLLVRSKFDQFARLVRQCEEGAGEHLVTCKDLQGFWDMMSMAVGNCDNRFQKVKELKARGWKEEDEVEKVEVRKAPVRKTSQSKKNSPAKKKSPSKKAPAKSSLRAMILAARQKKKELENLEAKPADSEVVEIWKNVVRDSPTKVTPSKRTSSTTPQQRPTPKEIRTSFPLAAMAISQKSKTPEDKASGSKISLETQYEMEIEMDTDAVVEIVNVEVQLDESITYINSKHTPGKSILKRIKLESISDSDSRATKSTQKVIFDDNVELKEVEVDEEEKTKASLAAALARIDSSEYDRNYVPEVSIRAEKKLNFEDESFNETVNASLIEDEAFDKKETTCETLTIPQVKLIPPTPKSLRLSRQRKMTSDMESSIMEEATEEEEDVTFTKSLRNRTIVGNLTPKSPRRMNKENNSGSVTRGKSPRAKKDNSFHHVEERSNVSIAENHSQDDTKIDGSDSSLNHSLRSLRNVSKSPKLPDGSDLNGSLNQSLKSSRNVPKSPKLPAKSPRQTKPKKQAPKPPKPTQEKVDNESEPEKQNESLNSPKEGRTLRQTSPKQKKETKDSEKRKKSADKKETGSPVVTLAKMAARSTSLLYKLIKTPKSASKKVKKISKALELRDMQIDSDAESNQFDSPMKVNSKGLLKMEKTPNKSQKRKENQTTIEEKTYEEKMQLDDSISLTIEKPSALAKLFATPNDLAKTKSPRQRRKCAKGANKSSVEEPMDVESSASNVEGLPNENKMQVDVEEETEAIGNFTGSLKVEDNPLKQRNSRKLRSNENVLSEKETNDTESKVLNSSMKETKIPKPRTLRRSLRIPENELQVEKENATPRNLRNKALTPGNSTSKMLTEQNSINVSSSPKPSETASKRKSIKRSMSCHVEECKMAFTSTPQLQHSKSNELVKTPNGRRTMNLMSFDTP